MADASPPDRLERTADELLHALRRRGASRLSTVALRANRRRIWSLSADGARFNLHRAFSQASASVLDDLAVIAREARSGTRRFRAAARRVADWPVLTRAIRELRKDARRGEGRGTPGPCCATPGQRTYLQTLYDEINRARFGGRLPTGVPVRLSSRMRSRLGQMVPGRDDEGQLCVVEIALNADLMLDDNDAIRTETMVHEMAHVADLLEHGEVGHGPTWKRLALDAGCEPRALMTGSIRRRPRGTAPPTRVPPAFGL